MGRLWIAGDTHGGMTCQHLVDFKHNMGAEYKNITKDDIMLILGDAGFVWDGSPTDKYWAEIAEARPYTTVCVLGNHENYDLIEQLPVIDFCGGKAWRVNGSLIYLQGGLYTLGGKKCFVVNGADSIDKEHREAHISWWPQECLNWRQMHTLLNIAHEVGEVDYVFSHCTGNTIKNLMWKEFRYSSGLMERFMDEIYNTLTFKDAYFGHYHDTKDMNKYHCLYMNVCELV